MTIDWFDSREGSEKIQVVAMNGVYKWQFILMVMSVFTKAFLFGEKLNHVVFSGHIHKSSKKKSILLVVLKHSCDDPIIITCQLEMVQLF